MTTTSEPVSRQGTVPGTASTPARIAEAGEAISVEELQLAARNHGMPLEAMAYDITPPGLHYLLVHYDVPVLEAADWRLRIGGQVERPVELGLDDLRRLPRSSVTVTFECAGNGRALQEPRPQSQPWLVEAVGNATWTGVRLHTLLEQAGPLDGAVDVVFTGADHGVERGVVQDYARSLPVAETMAGEVLVAYEMNGQPLPPQHGFPARLLVPGWYGMAQVKWLVDVEVRDRAFDGFQNDVAYRIKTEPHEHGEPVTRIEPRALLIPPGYPDFYSRTRIVPPGPAAVRGRAWSGWAPVTRVELTVDDGDTWVEAELDPGSDSDRYAWRGWRATWDVEPGEHWLSALAHDASGRRQPVRAAWNRGGFANNSVQRVRAVCLG